MKSLFKSILCSLLAAAMLVPALVSCANNEETEKPKNTDITSEDGGDAPIFQETTFGGEDFVFLYYGDTATDFHDEYIWSENVTGSTIGDAVIDRNRLVEEKYDVVIRAEECGPMGEAIKRMQAGQCDFEVIYEWRNRSIGAALDGQLYDFLDLPYIDLEQSYWVPSLVEEMSVCNNLFISTNYISMNAISWAYMLFFNKELLDKMQYDYPYDYVYANQWIIDTYLIMITDSAEDLNGDGVMDASDQFGTFHHIPDHIYDEDWYRVTPDGEYETIGYTEGLIATYEKYKTKMDNISTITYEQVWGDIDLSVDPSMHIAARKIMFGEDHALFQDASMDMTKELINMKSDYGVCPVPKLHAEDEWYVTLDPCAPMFSMPFQLEDPDMTGIILEYMAYESENILLPAYYETTIKTKRMEDTRDYDMLDIIKSNVRVDGLAMYGGCSIPRSDMLVSGHFASVWKRSQAAAQAKLEETVALLEELDGRY